MSRRDAKSVWGEMPIVWPGGGLPTMTVVPPGWVGANACASTSALPVTSKA
jgi:hypothetical protein